MNAPEPRDVVEDARDRALHALDVELDRTLTNWEHVDRLLASLRNAEWLLDDYDRRRRGRQ